MVQQPHGVPQAGSAPAVGGSPGAEADGVSFGDPTPPAGLWDPAVSRPPSGLFPSGPPRPSYREPHPVRGWWFAAGVGAGAVWLLFLGMLGEDLVGYAWWTLVAGLVGWLVSGLLIRHGDRGVAAGVAVSVAVGVAIAAMAVATRWAETADWPLW